MASGTWLGESSRQSQAKPVKQQHTGISPNHVPEAVPYSHRNQSGLVSPSVPLTCQTRANLSEILSSSRMTLTHLGKGKGRKRAFSESWAVGVEAGNLTSPTRLDSGIRSSVFRAAGSSRLIGWAMINEAEGLYCAKPEICCL